jgi:hypothetical protein
MLTSDGRQATMAAGLSFNNDHAFYHATAMNEHTILGHILLSLLIRRCPCLADHTWSESL